MEYKELVPSILDWASEKNLLRYENRYAQFVKFCEEYTEFLDAVTIDERIDAIGDMLVVLIILSKQLSIQEDIIVETLNSNTIIYSDLNIARLGSYLIKNNENILLELQNHINIIKGLSISHNLCAEDCLESAYKVIKNRTGKTINGSFIKDEK